MRVRDPSRFARQVAVALLLAGLALGADATRAQKAPSRGSNRGQPGGLASGVGIRVSVAALRPEMLEADLDLTLYTRVGPYSSTYAGLPYVGVPALDYGDGSTLPYTTLALASSGAGPGGSNVYRNLASFTHTYPALGAYTVTAGTFCTACFRSQYVLFPAGSPAPTMFTGSLDYVPQTVVGNFAATYAGTGTTYLSFLSTSVRYQYTFYAAVTNTAQLVLTLPPPVFTKSFSPAAIFPDGVATLTFSVDNTATNAAIGALAFTDPLPTGLLVASPSNASNSCGGTLTATAGSGTIQLSGGTVGALSTCSISVDVTANAEGSYDNSATLQSEVADSAPALATLVVAIGIPTVGTWGLVLLAVGLVALGWLRLRR